MTTCICASDGRQISEKPIIGYEIHTVRYQRVLRVSAQGYYALLAHCNVCVWTCGPKKIKRQSRRQCRRSFHTHDTHTAFTPAVRSPCSAQMLSYHPKGFVNPLSLYGCGAQVNSILSVLFPGWWKHPAYRLVYLPQNLRFALCRFSDSICRLFSADRPTWSLAGVPSINDGGTSRGSILGRTTL